MKIVINQGMPKNTELFNPGCPLVAFGTSSVQKEKLGEVLKFGVQCGFRVLNMSDEHSNETSVGMSLKSLITGGFIARQDLFISFKMTKIQNLKQLEKHISKHLATRNLTYFDLFVIENSPFVEENILKIWRTLENLHLSKLLRNIGLSGFPRKHMEKILSVAVIKPFAIQDIFNPFYSNNEISQFCQIHDLLLIGMSPLDYLNSKGKLLTNSTVTEIARNHNASPAQTLLAWAIQSQTLPVIQTLNTDHVKENIMLSDLKLSEKEMRDICQLTETE